LVFFATNAYGKSYAEYSLQYKESELIEEFHDWILLKNNRGDQEICYLLSTPISAQKTTYFRDKSFFIVTHSAQNVNEISTSSGFYYKENSNVEISFGSKKFYLFPYRNLAWANNGNSDIDIIKEMKKKDQFFVIGVSKDQELVIDIYSLVGFNQAYSKMNEECKNISNKNLLKNIKKS